MRAVWETVASVAFFGIAVAIATIYAARVFPDTLKESKP
jgi:hypothetical protein